MKILELYIYGYGKLENTVIKDLQELNVFFGENEAGKSTIMSFIHSILFGFPTKQQSELRYEPKKGAKYGGQMIIHVKELGKTIIERVKGKATGDVSVFLEDGTIGGEELLAELLSYIDKGLYQSIFSFNLQGLQNVHQLKSDDLGKFLFSTGTIGSDKLLTIEKNLQKELDDRFKPNGKKPSINVKLKEVRDVHRALKIAEDQNDQYGRLVQKKEELTDEILYLQNETQSLQKKIHQLEEWQKLYPIVKEKNMLERKIQTLEHSFPVDGISRLEQLHQLLQPIEGQLKAIAERTDKLKGELQENQPHIHLLNKDVDIFQAIEKLPLYDSLKDEVGELISKRRKILSEIDELKERLHFSIEEDELVQCDTSIFMKDKTFEAEKKKNRLKERKEELDEQFAKEKVELERLEGQIKVLQGDLLPQTEVEEKKQKLSDFQQKDGVERELHSVQDKLHLLKMTDKKEKQQLKQNFLQYSFLGLLFIFLAAWGVFQSQWGLIAIGVIGGVFILFLTLQTKKKGLQNLATEISELKEKERVLLHKLKTYSSAEMELIKEQLRKNSILEERLNVLMIKLEQQKAQYNDILQAYKALEKEFGELEALLRQLAGELFIPNEIALNHIHSAFLLIVELKECVRELAYTNVQIENKEKTMKGIKLEIDRLGEEFLQGETIPLKESAFLLKEKIKTEQWKKQKYDSLQEKTMDLKEQQKGLEKEYEHLLKERESLFEQAKVKTEEEFRLAGKTAESHAAAAMKVEELKKQIELSSLSESLIHDFRQIENIQIEIVELNERIEEFNTKRGDLLQILADVKHQISIIEEGGEYGELLHKYKQLQSELNHEAREWAKYQLAKEWMQKTVERFQNVHLPKMLNMAEQYLSFLTDGNYIHIVAKNDSSGFLIERKDHLFFDANELSQATKEQVYVALRLALATTIYKKYSFPIIIDDSFVNFDHNRAKKVIELIKNLKDNQILFFTCHKHLLLYFDDEEIIMM